MPNELWNMEIKYINLLNMCFIILFWHASHFIIHIYDLLIW